MTFHIRYVKVYVKVMARNAVKEGVRTVGKEEVQRELEAVKSNSRKEEEGYNYVKDNSQNCSLLQYIQ